MKTVMISGHFDPFHDGHLDYIEQAINYGSFILCVVSSDTQLKQKKGVVNIPGANRLRIVDLVLSGLHLPHRVILNVFDRDTTSIAEALRWHKPDILFRGYDKGLETMPREELAVCEEMGIKIVHAQNQIGERHGSDFK